MRKFTFMLIAALFAMASWAQAPSSRSAIEMRAALKASLTQKRTTNDAGPLAAFKLQRPVKNTRFNARAAYKAAAVVTPPAGEVLNYKFQATDDEGTATTRNVEVVFDGNDVYVSGLSYYMEDAWVKGTINGATATFPTGQYYGNLYGYDFFLGGIADAEAEEFSDVIAAYDAETGNFVFSGFILDTKDPAEGLSYYAYWLPGATLTKLAESDIDKPVVAPVGMTTEEYAVKGISHDYNQETWELEENPLAFNVQAGFVTTSATSVDVYVQGLCQYLPEAWVKGTGAITADGMQVKFASGQFFGTYVNRYDLYFVGLTGPEDEAEVLDEVVFNYDIANNKLVLADGQYVGINIGTKDEPYWTSCWSNLTITKVIEMAGTPANPAITDLVNGEYGWYILFDIPTVDTEGNGLVTSKLFYQIFTDTEKEISPVVFTPTTQTKLTEDMSIIPYGFTEDYDFYNDQLYLNELYNKNWNKIGIKSIYTGGGETNETEIQWYDIKPYSTPDTTTVAGTVATFNFNEMDVATSGNGKKDGDITSDTTITEGSVSLTISPKTAGTTENRFWGTNNGPQLRVYSGSLTFSVPEDSAAMTKIVFNYNGDKWNEYNSADSGEFDGITWTGEAKNVVFTIAGNTQINSIEVTCGNGGNVEPIEEYTLVELPEGVESEEYTLNITFGGEDSSGNPVSVSRERNAQVAFDGNDVYLSGLSYYLPDSYVKGTKNAAGQYVFAASQYIGEDDGDEEYLVGGNANGEIAEYSFDFDAETRTLTLAKGFAIYECGEPTDIEGYWVYVTEAVYTPGGIVLPELVVVPEGVETETYTIEGTFEDEDGANNIVRPTEVAFDGTDIYVKGIPLYFEDAWLKGTVDAENGLATFPTGQFVGNDEYGSEFMVGYNGEIADIVFTINAETKILTQQTSYILENKTADTVDPWGFWYDMIVYPGEAKTFDPVVVPENLTTETYKFTAVELVQSTDEEIEYDARAITKNIKKADRIQQPYEFQTEVGFDGNDVYFKGFSDNTGNFWAKGTLSADGKTVTIPANQFMGTLTVLWFTFNYYVTAVDEEGKTVDLVLNYDAENNTFTTAADQFMVLHDKWYTLGEPYQVFYNVEIKKMVDVAATPADPSIEKIDLEGRWPYIGLNIPAEDVDGNELLTSKLYYTLWVEKDGKEQTLTLDTILYKNLTEDMTEIPYNFDDGYDFVKGGEKVYLNQSAEEMASWTKIGVQSIYYGADDCNKSNIVWNDGSTTLVNTGIASVNYDNDKVVYFDLQGRKVSNSVKGLVIMQTQQANGNMKTVKVVR